MEPDKIAFLSFISSGTFFLILGVVFTALWRRGMLPPMMIAAATISAAWGFLLAAHFHPQLNVSLSRPWLLVLESLRGGLWISAPLLLLHFASGGQLAIRFRGILHGSWLLALAGSTLLALLAPTQISGSLPLIWVGLILSIMGLVAVEQLYRNAYRLRLVKLLGVGIGALFIYDIYLFSHGLIFARLDPDLWHARGIAHGLAALLMATGAAVIAWRGGHPSRLSMSRPVIFYTTSMTVAGVFLGLMALGGYYVQLYGGEWGTVLRVMLMFAALLAVAVLFVSHTVRSRVNVWINKHFFHHKYDYRVEWLRLINSLSRPASGNENFFERNIRAVASIFKSPSGGLWLRQGDQYLPVHTVNLTLPASGAAEPVDTAFCQALREREWVFSPYSPENNKLSAYNDLLPDWIYQIEDLWLVLPLLTEESLLGFMVLTEPPTDNSLTWEDLDLLKTVGRQVASYLDRQLAAEMLAESRQFDAFNKLTAFIMHDLKNLIAQQALVVENAAKHKENPAFVEDAIKTIENSVGRMSNLLRKLQRAEPAELRNLSLHKILMEAVKRCQTNKPTPSLRLEDTDLRINADQDQLIMTLTHVIKNAQEATESSGFVDVTLRRDGNNAMITVEDNGVGMDPDFVRNHLFKPFVTTKSSKGMGIGVYQTREIISSLGGTVTVDSTPGEGTTFTIAIPASKG